MLEGMKHPALCAALIGTICTTAPSLAAACEIEDWRYFQRSQYIQIEGATTCREGRLAIRMYDGQDNYIGNATTYIRGHTFDTMVQADAPDSMNIRYTID